MMGDYMCMVSRVFMGWREMGLSALVARFLDSNVCLGCAVASFLRHELISSSSDLQVGPCLFDGELFFIVLIIEKC